jgi:hypothetical protein
MSNTIFSAIHSPITFIKGTDESTSKTLLQIGAPTNTQVKVLRWGVFFNEEIGDASPASPLKVDVYRSTVIDGTGSVLTPNKVNNGSATLQSSVKHSFTVSPTNSLLIDSAYVNAQGSYEVILPMTEEIILNPSEALNLVVTSGTVLSTGDLSVFSKIWFEE